MKRIVTLAMALALTAAMGSWCLAYETDFDDLRRFDRNLPGWKLGRGIVNILGAPNELFSNITNGAIDGMYWGAYDEGFQGAVGGSLNGMIAGTFPGLSKMVRRMTTGALEVLTFWKPEYGPTVDPTYGTRCRAFPTSDYFDPDPYWYWGPPR
ncbi:MAG: hypothetical protein HY913_22840 [Desulfomonile tiedjei]|nr:hypothetical protein [Desulfomonile tiedjei]